MATAAAIPSVANCIDVAAFTSLRLRETDSLLNSLTIKKKQSKRLFQRLHFEYRRRAQSHNPYRIPRRCRAAVFRDFNSSTPLASKRPRRDRRKIRNLRAVFEARSGKSRWLETHLWHAKRMHIKPLWGYKLAVKPTQKSFRKLHRWSHRRCVIYDKSYCPWIQVELPTSEIRSLFHRLACDKLDILNFGKFILRRTVDQILGPVEYITQEDAEKTIVIFNCHPALKEDLESSLRELKIDFWENDNLNIFDLYGPEGIEVLITLMKACKARNPLIIEDLSLNSVFANEGKVFTLSIQVPKVLGPFPRCKSLYSRASKVSNISGNIKVLRTENSVRAAMFSMKPSEHFSQGKLVSGQNNWLTFELVRRSTKRRDAAKIISSMDTIIAPAPTEKESTVKEHETKCVELMISFSLLGKLPRICIISKKNCCSRQIWTLLNKFGARAIGLENYMKLCLSQELFYFPYHWPLTPAGEIEALKDFKQIQEEYDRRPPNHRLNHKALNLHFPFGMSWTEISGTKMFLPEENNGFCRDLSLALKKESFTDVDLYSKYVPVKVLMRQGMTGIPEKNSTIWSTIDTSHNFSHATYAGFVSGGGHCLKRGSGFGLGYVRCGVLLDKIRQKKQREAEELLKIVSNLEKYLTSKPSLLLKIWSRLFDRFPLVLIIRHVNGKQPSPAEIIPHFDY